MYGCMCMCACPCVRILEARGQHQLSSFRNIYLTYCNSVSVNLKLAVLNRVDGKEESRMLGSEVTNSWVPGRKFMSSHLQNKYFTHWDSSPGSHSFQHERVKWVSAVLYLKKTKASLWLRGVGSPGRHYHRTCCAVLSMQTARRCVDILSVVYSTEMRGQP